MLIKCKITKDAHRLETPAEKINEDKDKIEHLIALMSKINFGLDFSKHKY